MDNNNSYAPANSLANDNYAVRQYINSVGSIFGPALASLILAVVAPLIGQIVALILSGSAKSKIANLPVIDESTLDPATLEEYRSAVRKIKASRILAKIAGILACVTLILCGLLIIFYAIFFVVLMGM